MSRIHWMDETGVNRFSVSRAGIVHRTANCLCHKHAKVIYGSYKYKRGTHHVGPCFRSNSFLMYAATSCDSQETVRTHGPIDTSLEQYYCVRALRYNKFLSRKADRRTVLQQRSFRRSINTRTGKHTDRQTFRKTSTTHLFNAVFREGLGRDVYRILLHVIAHVRILDYCFSLLTHTATAAAACGYWMQCAILFDAIITPFFLPTATTDRTMQREVDSIRTRSPKILHFSL